MHRAHQMNANYVLKRLLGRATCVLEHAAVLHPEARVRNPSGDSRAIRVGEFSRIKGELLVFWHGGRIDIGSYCFVGQGARVWSGEEITIGNRTLISHNVNIFDNLTHPTSARARHEQFKAVLGFGSPSGAGLECRPVRIGADVLVGCSSTILRGVTIGDGAIVGAGSVVVRDVPAWTIVAGNPARHLRDIQPEDRW